MGSVAEGTTQVRGRMDRYSSDMHTRKLVCVYCGAGCGRKAPYADAARRLGEALVDNGYGLVYGATDTGLMRVVSQAVLEAGGDVVGVMPSNLAEKDLARSDCTETFIVGSMHERKAKMLELAEAIVVLPGGVGTLDEFFEALTWRDLGLHSKPIALLDVAGYWEPLRELVERAIHEGFARPEVARLFEIHRDPAQLVESLTARPREKLEPRWGS